MTREYGVDTAALNAQERAHEAHEHKFASAREHRRAHKEARQAAARQRVRRIPVVRSEWLDRQPGSAVAAGFKQPGRRFGPAVIGSGLGPREGAQPVAHYYRERAYVNQPGRERSNKLTPAQRRRIRKKFNKHHMPSAHECVYQEPDGTTAGVCHLPGAHGGRAAS